MIAQDRIRTRSEEERDAGARFAAVACAAARLSFPRADSDAAPFLKRDPRISFGLARPSRCSSQLPALNSPRDERVLRVLAVYSYCFPRCNSRMQHNSDLRAAGGADWVSGERN